MQKIIQTFVKIQINWCSRSPGFGQIHLLHMNIHKLPTRVDITQTTVRRIQSPPTDHPQRPASIPKLFKLCTESLSTVFFPLYVLSTPALFPSHLNTDEPDILSMLDDDDDVSPECLEHKIGIFNNQNRWDGNDAEHLQSEIKEKQMFTMNPDHCSSKLLTNGHEDTSWCRGSVNLLIDKTRYKKSGRSKGKDMCMILPKKDIICEGHDDIDSLKRKVCRYCQRT